MLPLQLILLIYLIKNLTEIAPFLLNATPLRQLEMQLYPLVKIK